MASIPPSAASPPSVPPSTTDPPHARHIVIPSEAAPRSGTADEESQPQDPGMDRCSLVICVHPWFPVPLPLELDSARLLAYGLDLTTVLRANLFVQGGSMIRRVLGSIALVLLLGICSVALAQDTYLDSYIVQVKPEKRAQFDALAKKIA